jgi:hypothetical protein
MDDPADDPLIFPSKWRTFSLKEASVSLTRIEAVGRVSDHVFKNHSEDLVDKGEKGSS